MRTLAFAACAIAFSGAALAQDNSQFAGVWQCQMTYAEYNANGWQSGFSRFFQLNVQPNGQYQAQGYQPGVGGNEPFQSQGQWKAEQGHFSAAGPETHQTSLMGTFQGQFAFFGKIDPEGRVMTAQYPQTPQGQQPQGPRTSYMCEKR